MGQGVVSVFSVVYQIYVNHDSTARAHHIFNRLPKQTNINFIFIFVNSIQIEGTLKNWRFEDPGRRRRHFRNLILV